MKQLYVSTLLRDGDDFKVLLAQRFALNYVRIANCFLSCSQDFNDSLINFSGTKHTLMVVQLFIRTPSSVFLLKHTPIFRSICSILISFYASETLDQLCFLETYRKCMAEPQRQFSLRLDKLKCMPMNEKPWRIISDLSLLVFNDTNRKQLMHSDQGNARRDLSAVLGLCRIFHGMYVLFSNTICRDMMQRAVSAHVEHETESWVNIYCLLYELNRQFQNFTQSFLLLESSVTFEIVKFALRASIGNILDSELAGPPVKLSTLVYATKTHEIRDFAVSSDPISLHYPLHFFLGLTLSTCMASHARTLDWGFINDASIATGTGFDECVCRIQESCMRHFSIMSQIAAGFWIRNGNTL